MIVNNLGVIYARTGKVDRSVSLWRDAMKSSPWYSEIGMNLATVLMTNGERSEARDVLHRVLTFNPDLGRAKRLLREAEREPDAQGVEPR